jgi:hypothetical protein
VDDPIPGSAQNIAAPVPSSPETGLSFMIRTAS